jgi:hypothetical protein
VKVQPEAAAADHPLADLVGRLGAPLAVLPWIEADRDESGAGQLVQKRQHPLLGRAQGRQPEG